METTLTTPIHAGSQPATALWDPNTQTFGAVVELFDGPEGSYPPPTVRIGHRPGELPTVDALASVLAQRGLAIDGASADQLQELRGQVEQAWGGTELVGVGDGGERRLYLLTPARLVLPLAPAVDHPSYRFHWGDSSPATVETARVLGERVLGRGPAHDLDLFALTLTVDYLSSVQGDFSIDASGLADWYLAETPLATALSPLDLLALRHRSTPGPVMRAA